MSDLKFDISNPLGFFSTYVSFSLKFKTTTFLPKNPNNVLEFSIDYDTDPDFTQDQCYANFTWWKCTLSNNKLRIYPVEEVRPANYEIRIVRAIRLYES